MEIHFAPDLPIHFYTEDRLNFRDFANTLQHAIYHTAPPFTYGLLGDWGAGKTSILNLLYNLIDNDQRSNQKPYVPIYFEAWKYESEANLIYPLLYSIKADYQQRIPSPNRVFLEKFKEVALAGTIALADVGLRAVTKAMIGEDVALGDLAAHFDKLQERASDLENVLSGWADQVGKLDETFHELLGNYAVDLQHVQGGKFQQDQYRFVILVDDLDRCLPQTAIAILESIKNHLLVDNCIFVLALNPRVVYQGMRVKYEGLQVDGREYLEKILNYSFYVPDPQPEAVAQFARQALDKLVEEADRPKLIQWFDDFGQVVRDCQFTNPRKVKRILNHFLYFLQVHEAELQQFHMPNIIRCIVLGEYFPDLFQVFLDDAETARDTLKDVGSPKFALDEFEKQYGVSVTGIYPQLRRMHRLFELPSTSDRTRPSLTQQARLVYQIVHHPL